MNTLERTGRFKRDVKKAQKRGYDMEKLKGIIRALEKGEPLEPRIKDHKLVGDYEGYRECHIEPDWLLIYKHIPEDHLIILVRTGTHSDLF